MVATASNPVTAETRRFSIHVSRPLWIGVVTLGLVVTATGLLFGLPIYAKQRTVRKFFEMHVVTAHMRGEPNWLRRLGGDDWMQGFDQISSIDFSFADVGDDDLAAMSRLSTLQHLVFDGSSVTDAQLRHIRNLPRLASLGLNGTRITDAGLRSMHRLPKLRNLDLQGTRITDSGLEHLEAFIEDLVLDGTPVTNAGLAHLHGMPNLRQRPSASNPR
jgi:hypothetical protein